MVYVNSLSVGSKMLIHPDQKAQIALLIAKEITVLVEYSDFADVFLKELAEVLPEYTGINKHALKLKDGKQSFYKPIYSLGPVEFETLKIYIKTNLANDYTQSLKSPASALILFVCKPNDSLR